jgi:DNA-directed RNA polymerase specialized sigma subunit
LELRFADELTQLEIGRRIGRSQMCVSRTLIKTLAQMRVVASRESSVA